MHPDFINGIVNNYLTSGQGLFAASIDPELKALMEELQKKALASKNAETLASHVLDTLIKLQAYRAKHGSAPGRFEAALLEIVQKAPTGDYEKFLFAPMQHYLQSAIDHKQHNATEIEAITPFEPGVISQFFSEVHLAALPDNKPVNQAFMAQAIQDILYARSFFEFETRVNDYIKLVEGLEARTKGVISNLFDRFKTGPSKDSETVAALKEALEKCRAFSFRAKEEALALVDSLNDLHIEDRSSVFASAEERFTMARATRAERQSILTPSPARLTVIQTDIAPELAEAINSMPHVIADNILNKNASPDALLKNIDCYLASDAEIDPLSIETIADYVLKHGSQSLQEKLTTRLGTLLTKNNTLALVQIDRVSFFIDAAKGEAVRNMVAKATKDSPTLLSLLQNLAIIRAQELSLTKSFLEKKANKYTTQEELKDYHDFCQNALKGLSDKKTALRKEAFGKISPENTQRFIQAYEGVKFYQYEAEVIEKINSEGITPGLLKETIAEYRRHLQKIADENGNLLLQPLNDLFIGLLTYVVDNNGQGRSDDIRGLLFAINHFLSTDNIFDAQEIATLRKAITKKMFDIARNCKETGRNPENSTVYRLLKTQLSELIEAEIETDSKTLADSADRATIADFANLYQKAIDITSLAQEGVDVSKKCEKYLKDLPAFIIEGLNYKITTLLDMADPIKRADAIQKVLIEIQAIQGKLTNQDFQESLQKCKEKLTAASVSQELKSEIALHVKKIQQQPITAGARALKKHLDTYQEALSARMFGNASRQDSLAELRQKLDTHSVDAQRLRATIVSQLTKIEQEYKGWWNPNRSQLYRTLLVMRDELDKMSVVSLTTPFEILQGNHPFIEEQITTLSSSIMFFYNDKKQHTLAKNNLLSKIKSALNTVVTELSNNKPFSFSPTSICVFLKTLSEIKDNNAIEEFLDKVYEWFEENPLNDIFAKVLTENTFADLPRIKMLAVLQKALTSYKSDEGFSEAFINNNLPTIPSKIDELITAAQYELANSYVTSNQGGECQTQATLLAQFCGISSAAKPSLAEMLTTIKPTNRLGFNVLAFLEKAMTEAQAELTADVLEAFKAEVMSQSVTPEALAEFLGALQAVQAEHALFQPETITQMALWQIMAGHLKKATNDPANYTVELLKAEFSAEDSEQRIALLHEAFSEIKIILQQPTLDANFANQIREILTAPQAAKKLPACLDSDDKLKALLKSVMTIQPPSEAGLLLRNTIGSTISAYERQEKTSKALVDFQILCEKALEPLDKYNHNKDQSRSENSLKTQIVQDFRNAIRQAKTLQGKAEDKTAASRLIVELEKLRAKLETNLTQLRKPSKIFMPELDHALATIKLAAENYHTKAFHDENFEAFLQLARDDAAASYHPNGSEPSALAEPCHPLITGLSDMLNFFEGYRPTGFNITAKNEAIKGFVNAVQRAIGELQARPEEASQITQTLAETVAAVQSALNTKLQNSSSSLPNKLQQGLDKINQLVAAYQSATVNDNAGDEPKWQRSRLDSASFSSVSTAEEVFTPTPTFIPETDDHLRRSLSSDTVDLMAAPAIPPAKGVDYALSSMNNPNKIYKQQSGPGTPADSLTERTGHRIGAFFQAISGPSLRNAMARIGAAVCLSSLLHKFTGAIILYFSASMLPFVVDVLRALRNAYA